MKRKGIIWGLILALMMPTIVYGADTRTESQHWGMPIMQQWHEKGLVNGYPDGSLRPDEQITRAQFVTLLNGVFHYGAAAADSESGQTAFKDVAENAWYYDDITAVAAAGIIQGYPDGSFKPDGQVSRQDAAAMLATAFKLAASEGQTASDLAQFKDQQAISSYARQAVESLLAEGALHGYPDQTIKPLKALTRAEAVTLLDRLSGQIIGDAGAYRGLTVDGNLIIHTPDVVLENVKVAGNVYVAAGVGEGDLHMDNVEIAGTLHINGGGVNSIYLSGMKAHAVLVNKIGGKVRVVISDKSRIDQLDVEHEAIIELDKDSYIALLAFLKGAAGSELKGTGTIEELLNAAGITLPENYKEGKNSGNNGSGQQGSGTGSGGGTTPQPTTPPATSDWKLVWSDEFDRSGTNLDTNGVDLDKWGYQLGTGSQYGLDGWGNNEQQYYRSENMVVEDGLLKITAKKEQHEGKPYTSGRLYTDPTFSRTYGKFEARIKMPEGKGLWPAFWMMPQNSAYGVWAASGEIDIMEARGRLIDEVGGAIHYGKFWPNNKSAAKTYHFAEGEDITDFHVYGFEWEPGELRWYVDGELYQKINNWDSWGEDQPAKYAFPAPFDKPFYMILNLAVGGNYDGGVMPEESMESAEMQVDYVRVYDLAGRPYRQVEEPSIEVEPITEPYKQAVDGSYIYDADFEQPINTITNGTQAFNENYWNFVYLDTFGGAGELSVDTIAGDRYAKASITQAGGQAHSIQLIQHVTVGKGRWYKLSFDAKSDANRNMAVKIGGGETRGWSVYSDSYEIALTNELQSYSRVFQMAADTDKQARLEFNMGLNSSPIWIGNVRLEEVSAPDPYNEDGNKEPLADGNHIYNGSFELGYIHRLTYWQLHTAEQAAAQLSVDAVERELRADITKGGEQAGDIALLQKGVSLIGGNTYELTLNAHANENRTIEAALLSAEGTVIGQSQSIELTGEMSSYRLQFALEGEEASYGQLALYLGGAAGTIYVDDIKLVRTTNNNVGGMPLELQFPLKNGDFTNGLTNWSEHVQGRYDGWDQHTGIANVDEELEYTIWSAGNNPWDVMLSQADLQLKKNQTYVVSLDAKASQAREMEIVLETANYQRFVSERVALGTEWQSYSYELPMTEDALVSLKLLLGKLENAAPIAEHTVWIDNVRVEVKDARSQAFLATNGYFDDGMNGWVTHVQGVYEGSSQAGFSADNKAVDASIANWGANAWDVMLFQNPVSVSKGKTYVVSFVAHASTARNIEVIAENSGYIRSLNQAVALTEDVQKYSYEFTMERDEPVQLKFLLGKPSGAAGDAAAHHVYIDNVQFELKGARAATGEVVRTEHDLDKR